MDKNPMDCSNKIKIKAAHEIFDAMHFMCLE